LDSVLRAAIIYVFLLVLFRATGKRTLAQATPFDLILVLIMSEAVQNGMVGKDYSLTNAMLIVTTLLITDIGVAFLARRFKLLDRWIENIPLILLQDGQVIRERLAKSRIDETDIMEAARQMRGLERMDQIKYAILERNGDISIIPK
jgi:uncharacterized membrane protein YcaP (DUF421 family)